MRAILLGAAAVAVLAPATAASADPSPSDVQQQIDQSSSALEKIVEQYNGVGEKLKATQAAADDLNAKMAPLQSQLDTAYASVGQIAATAYKGGAAKPMALLLSDGSPESLLGQLTSLNHLASVEQRQIQGYAQAKTQYDEQKKKLDDLLNQQRADQKSLADQKAKIEGDVANLMALRKRLLGSATATPPAKVAAPNIAGSAGAAVRFAYGVIGKPYVYAAAGPNGYDCSGLTMAAWRAAGRSLPHNAEMQWNQVAHISSGQLQPGDLVFYSGLGHVAIYVGNGQVIHAPQPGDYVKLASVNMMPPYGYGRVR
ncbi:glycoside hydrolase [Planosporangium mesophilum]|nr:C40 family peptidase [Planosporangium mesophilum]NJC81338.1 glycoside hydrolase [Planosporangium mesophilum]